MTDRIAGRRGMMACAIAVWSILFLALTGPAQAAESFEPGSPDANRFVQSTLIDLGFDPGAPDGALGTKTRDALCDFQASLTSLPPALLSKCREMSVERNYGRAWTSLYTQLRGALAARDLVAAIDGDDPAAIDAALAASKPHWRIRGTSSAGPYDRPNRGFWADPALGKRVFAAIAARDMALVERLVQGGLLEARNPDEDGHDALLQWAIAQGDGELFRIMLAHSDDLERTSRGQTPLVVAINARDKEVVEALIAAGANVDRGQRQRLAPIDVAVETGDIGLVQTLIDAGATVEGSKALKAALDGNRQDIADLLMAHGAKLPAQIKVDMRGITADGYVKYINRVSVTGRDRLAGINTAYRYELRHPDPKAYYKGKLTLKRGARGFEVWVTLVKDTRRALTGEIRDASAEGDGKTVTLNEVITLDEPYLQKSFVVGQGALFPPTSPASLNKAGLGDMGLPANAIVFRVRRDLALEILP